MERKKHERGYMKKNKKHNEINLEPIPNQSPIISLYKCIRCGWYLKHKGFLRRKYFCRNENCDRYGLQTFVMKGDSLKEMF